MLCLDAFASSARRIHSNSGGLSQWWAMERGREKRENESEMGNGDNLDGFTPSCLARMFGLCEGTKRPTRCSFASVRDFRPLRKCWQALWEPFLVRRRGLSAHVSVDSMAKSIMSPLSQVRPTSILRVWLHSSFSFLTASQVWPDREHGWGCRTVIFGHLVPQISFIEW